MGTVDGVICQQGGRVKIVVPALRCQEGLAILPVVVQQGLEESFVMVMIRLGFQQDTIDVDGQLFDQGVGQVGDGVQHRVVRQVGRRIALELDFHFKITAVQIQEGVSGRNQKFHGVDAGGDRSQLGEPHPLHGHVRLGYLKDLQFGAHDPRGGVVHLHRLNVVCHHAHVVAFYTRSNGGHPALTGATS